MRALWSGSISFGLVNIPVKLYSGSESHGLDLDMLRRKDLSPIRYARIAKVDGKEVPWEEIVKGYEYEDGDYVILDPEDFEKANVEKTNTIDIESFTEETEIDTIYYDKPYYLEPQKGSLKAYALLRKALKQSGMVGIGTFVLRNREHIGVIKSYEDLLVLNQLRYHDEIRDHSTLKLPEENLVQEEEMKIAQKLIKQLTKKFKPEKYKDTYIVDLKKVIEAKAKGKELKRPKKVEEKGEVADLMSLLKKSLKDKKGAA